MPPLKNPKHKSPVSSSAGKGLPALQYSIAEMMIHIGMAQRIIPSVTGSDSGRSTTSSPLSVASNESLTHSTSSVSIESSVQEEAVTNVLNCETVSVIKEDSAGTDNSTSSKDTVIQSPAQVAESRAEHSVKDNEQSLLGRGTSKDDVVKEESHTDRELKDSTCSSGLTLEKEDGEKSLEQPEAIRDGKTVHSFLTYRKIPIISPSKNNPPENKPSRK